jgi:glycerate kinase
MGAHTFAFGQVLANAARDSRVQQIYCALGGSASTDAGVGALMALGFEFLDSTGQSISLGGAQLSKIVSISHNTAILSPQGGVVLLADVDSPLLGVHGAASVFAPQKGATPYEISQLELGLQNFSNLTHFDDSPGSGAAGGTAFGLRALWGATIENGAEKIAQICRLDDAIRASDLVITGEGRLDSQSFRGKVVGHITDRATTAGVPIAYCVGSMDGGFPSPSSGGITLSELAGSTKESMENAQRYLFEAGVKLASFL